MITVHKWIWLNMIKCEILSNMTKCDSIKLNMMKSWNVMIVGTWPNVLQFHYNMIKYEQTWIKLKDRITPHEKLTMYPLFGDLFPLTQRSFLRPRSLLRRPRSLLPRPRVCLYDWIYAAQSERSVNLNSTSMIECNRSRAVRPRPDAARAHLCVSWTSANSCLTIWTRRFPHAFVLSQVPTTQEQREPRVSTVD